MVFFRSCRATATAAVGLLAFSVAATELSGDIAARRGGQDLEPREPKADCKNAQYMWADVDCYYEFHKDGDFLNYIIRVEPTGQSNKDSAWCKGIMDNIYGECGRNPDGSDMGANAEWESCKDYLEYTLHNPVSREHYKAKGIDLNFHYNWPWKEGEDATKCIKKGIEKGICPEQKDAIKFKKDGCYKAW